MKKTFFRALPYILFTLVALLLLVGVTALTFAIEVMVCVIAGVAPTAGLVWFAVISGLTAMGIFIVEES